MTPNQENLEDLIARVPPKKKRGPHNGKSKSSISPALRRRLIELLRTALAPTVAYTGDVEAMRKAAEENVRRNILAAIDLLES